MLRAVVGREMAVRALSYLKQNAVMHDKAIALLKLANRAGRDVREGKTLSPEEAIKRLRNE